jgi:2-amino-4-hydroxy-6-hydroxymethyldihydropteridine diphosphokinase
MMDDSSIAYISLGSNIGDREDNLKKALALLDEHPQIRVAAVSSFYETAPVGYTDQPDFINAAAELETALGPRELLKICMETEKKLGRVRTIRWGPRVIDIDILWYNGLTVDEEDLQIPHPRMLEREFVIRPLADIAPDMQLANGKTVSEVLQEIGHSKNI